MYPLLKKEFVVARIVSKNGKNVRGVKLSMSMSIFLADYIIHVKSNKEIVVRNACVCHEQEDNKKIGKKLIKFFILVLFCSF